MEPIVSPWIIYLISTVSKMHDMLAVSFGLLVVVCFLGFVFFTSSCFDEDGESLNEDGDSLNLKKKYGKKVFIAIIVNALLLVAVPEEKTMTAMLVAQYATENNLNYILDVTKQIIEEVKK